MSSSPNLYLLKTENLRRIVDERHLTHGDFAQMLGISRSHWSQLLNRRRPLTATMRRTLLESRLLRGVSAAELWEVVPGPEAM